MRTMAIDGNNGARPEPSKQGHFAANLPYSELGWHSVLCTDLMLKRSLDEVPTREQ
jgi:hypothetical protein